MNTPNGRTESEQMSRHPADSSIVISYLGLRKMIGIIGITLPFALALGKLLLNEPGIQPSISAYYYTGVRNIFVGGLCAIGVFLGSYRGYEPRDNIAGKLACVFAIGVALFPVRPDTGFTGDQEIIGRFHLAFATALFLTLAYFCLKLFTMTHQTGTPAPTKHPTVQKKRRNKIYKVCGYAILACIGLIVLFEALFLNSWSLFPDYHKVAKFDPVFVFESIAIVAFGFSWLTKGEAILADNET